MLEPIDGAGTDGGTRGHGRSMTTCVIGWLDEQGEPTQDDHESVGFAFTRIQGLMSVSESMHWPICHEHLERMRAFPQTWGWQFEPLALEGVVKRQAFLPA